METKEIKDYDESIINHSKKTGVSFFIEIDWKNILQIVDEVLHVVWNC